MFYLELKIPVKSIHQTFISGQCLKRDRIDKIRGILRHQHMDICMKLLKRTCQICDLICGNTSCDPKKYSFPFQHPSSSCQSTMRILSITGC